jgi:molybdate transport system ATP-binding protein
MLDVAITHRFPGFALDVAFTAPEGVTVLFGRSGAGKTTVVDAVAGLIRCDLARITLGARTLDNGRTHIAPHRRRIGYVFQDARLFPHFTVRQNLSYGRWFSRRRPLSFDDIAALLGLETLLHRRPVSLSGGEKQRVAIGRALLSDPELLLLDEPLAALDDPRKAEILPYLERLRDAVKLPMLYVSHALPEVARLATTIVVLDQGRVQRAGPATEILADPALAALIGLREAGSILIARLAATEPDGLSRLETPSGALFLPGLRAAPGTLIRLRIPAQDVILSRLRPEGLSALNILAATVLSLTPVEGAAMLVQLALGDQRILARITRRSAEALALAPGTRCHAILKTVALAQGDAAT